MRLLFVMAVLLSSSPVSAQEQPFHRAEFVFPYRSEHNHASGLVECSNGELICSWYRGKGERSADDVAVYGARLHKNQAEWSPDFLMADFADFPDCNTCMMIDPEGRLWLFWPVILANSWESAITNYLYSRDYLGDGCPKWAWNGAIYLKPADFKDAMLKNMDEYAKQARERIAKLPDDRRDRATTRLHKAVEGIKSLVNQKLYQRIGWQPRCKPTVLPPSDRLPNGRFLLPLYSDTFSIGIMAVSDDKGRSWYASKPLIGFGAIQPTVVRKNDGTLVAFMRDNGGSGHIRTCESNDDGINWGPVGVSQLPNPGAGIDAVRLGNGHWCLVYNDTRRGRNNLAVSISDDEGKNWKWTRHLEKHEKGSYHYPCVIQGRDNIIHSVYSYSVPKTKGHSNETMKHAAFNEAWVQQGDK